MENQNTLPITAQRIIEEIERGVNQKKWRNQAHFIYKYDFTKTKFFSWKKGTPPSMKDLKRLAAAFGVDIEYLEGTINERHFDEEKTFNALGLSAKSIEVLKHCCSSVGVESDNKKVIEMTNFLLSTIYDPIQEMKETKERHLLHSFFNSLYDYLNPSTKAYILAPADPTYNEEMLDSKEVETHDFENTTIALEGETTYILQDLIESRMKEMLSSSINDLKESYIEYIKEKEKTK